MSEDMNTEEHDQSIEPIDSEHLELGNRKVLTDYYVFKDIENEQDKYKYIVFIRLNAKQRRFVNVRFDHCIFDGCYLNECVFDGCKFTGCRFIGCNFHLCAFTGCGFQYATFERTQIDVDILDMEAPLEENLRSRFARSLRMNYQQLGDAKAVNKAIAVELNATSVYLHKSWSSKETYYDKKYAGFFKRLAQFLKWSEFWIMDFIWGNGESALKLLRSVFLVILLISFVDTIIYHDAYNVRDYLHGFENSSAVFFGFDMPNEYPRLYVALIASIRLTLFALFTAILVKRFNRR